MTTQYDYADDLRELDCAARQVFGVHITDPALSAALIQAHALHRLADALAPLERIAGALEARESTTTHCDLATTPNPQEPPAAPSATPGGHPLDQGGWIRSRVPTEGDGDEQGEVVVTDSDGEHWELLRWHLVAPGQPWAPADADLDSLPATGPLLAHLAYPTSAGWIHDRVPGPADADQDGEVVIPASRGRLSRWACLPWSYVVPGQPWRPL